MKSEQPITQDEIVALRQQVEAAIATRQPQADIQFGGVTLELRLDESGQYTLGRAGQDAALLFRASQRPDGYPADAPFVGDVLVLWSPAPDGWSLAWPAPADIAGLLAELEEQCVADGWSVEVSRGSLPAHVHQRLYRQQERERFVTSAPGMVSMIHKQRRLF